MTEIGNEFEYGDFFAEFDGHYLGRGKTVISLTPLMRDIRQDDFQLLAKRQVKSVQWQITLQLFSPEKCWTLLGGNEGQLGMTQFSEGIFADGAVLKLYASDERMRGFIFKNALLSELQHTSGENLGHGCLRLKFIAEAAADKQYLARTPAGARPDGAETIAVWDIESVAGELRQILGDILEVVPEQQLRMNTSPAEKNSGYILSLNGCREWKHTAPRITDWKLSTQFPLEEKIVYDSKLFRVAALLHGRTLQTLPPGSRCRVDSLEMDNIRSIGGRSMCCAVMNFSVLSD